MSELFSVHRRLIGLGLMGVLVLALAVLGSVWTLTHTASAQGDGVVLVHLNPDGTDYAGNPYCPDGGLPVDDDGDTVDDRWIDDCNNITSQRHVIRTDGFATMTDPSWTIEGVGSILAADLCNNISDLTDNVAFSDDDGDTLADEDPDNEGVDDDGDYVDVDGDTVAEATCDGIDDDLDTVVDDGACIDEDPLDGVDNDNDGTEDGAGALPGAGNCSDGLDNDLDGTDFWDNECYWGIDEDPPDCVDNDWDCPGDTNMDGVFCGCGPGGLDVGVDEDPVDGWDNDFDANEFGWSMGPGTSNCTNGLDDDLDGTDMADAECQAFDGEDPLDLDDDGDTVADEDPAGSIALADEQCVVIHSSEPGETWVALTYNDGGASEITDEVVKEWDSLVDSVILLDDPADEDGDTDIDADDHHMADVQGSWQSYPVVWDEGEKRVRSYPPVEVVEIVHGEHDVLINAETITLHHPTQGAIFYVTVESDNGCTYFTDPAGVEDFGDEMNGVSDGGGRFVGPRVAPAQTQGLPSGGNLNPDSHTGTSAQGDYNIQDIYIDTTCEEQATITIWAGYPGSPGSLRVPSIEVIHINWETVEEAKQPQIRWAGEQIVLAKRWALPDSYYPNTGTEVIDDTTITILEDVCPHAGNIVQYNREDPSPGGLEEGIPNVGGVLAAGPDSVATYVDEECISRAVYESEEPGQVDVKTLMWLTPWGSVLRSEANWCIDTYNNIARNGVDDGGRPELGDWNGDTVVDLADLDICLASANAIYGMWLDPEWDPVQVVNKHAFLVWYIKIYQVSLTNTLARYDDHNAGDVDVPTSADEDDTMDVLNVSESTVLRVLVKGWFFGGNNSSRGAVCIDKDGDGDEAGSEPGVPYPLGQYEEGCVDPDDEILDHGHWVLPDDMEALAGAYPEFTRRSWDVMSDVGDDPAELEGVEGSYIGPKSTLDSHDNVVRPWLGRKTVDPDGEVTSADAIMPPLKIRALIEDPNDAGFFHHNIGGQYPEVDKDADNNLYDAILIPADEELPWQTNNCGYDWNSWADFGPYEFWHIFNKPVSQLDGCDGAGPGALCNAGVGNQADHRSNDPEHPRIVELYSDNRGEAQIGLNGDYNLDFGLGFADGCTLQALWGAPDCEEDDVVGWTTVQVIGDYPFCRKHASILSNPVDKVWTWGGFKDVSAERVDATHTAIIAHLKDRDGYCKYDVDVDEDDELIEVVFSPSANPVQHEEITFILNTEVGSIVDISNYAGFSAPHTPLGEAIVTSAEDGVLIDRSEAVALAEDARVLEGMELFGMIPVGARDPMVEDECQAWILIEHPVDQDPDVSVYFDDPEGTVARHWPPNVLLVNLVMGWNDACYVGPSASVEVAAEDLLGDVNENGVTDLLAIYRFDNETQEFDRWFPDAEADVNTIETLEPYDQLFVLMEIGIDWLQEITAAPDSADLVEAWNSICYAGADKAVELATSNIIGDFEILYTLGSDQMWRRFVPGEAWLTNIITLNQYTSVFLLVTTEGGATWVFDP